MFVVPSLERQDFARFVNEDSDLCLLLTAEAQESVSKHRFAGACSTWKLRLNNPSLHKKTCCFFGKRKTGVFVYPGPAEGFFLFIDANIRICKSCYSVLFADYLQILSIPFTRDSQLTPLGWTGLNVIDTDRHRENRIPCGLKVIKNVTNRGRSLTNLSTFPKV